MFTLQSTINRFSPYTQKRPTKMKWSSCDQYRLLWTKNIFKYICVRLASNVICLTPPPVWSTKDTKQKETNICSMFIQQLQKIFRKWNWQMKHKQLFCESHGWMNWSIQFPENIQSGYILNIFKSRNPDDESGIVLSSVSAWVGKVRWREIR